MSISENIFRIMNERHFSQKEFSQLIGVPESTISDWKRKGKTPNADKIMDICKALDANPYEILEQDNNTVDTISVDLESDVGQLVLEYNSMNQNQRDRLKGYIDSLLM